MTLNVKMSGVHPATGESGGKSNPVDEAFESLFSNHKNRLIDQGIVYPAEAVIFHQDTLPHASI